MNKTKMFKRVVCFVIALMMLMPSMPSNWVSAAVADSDENAVWPNPGSINLTKDATKAEGEDGRWRVDLTVEGKNLDVSSDIVLVIDRSGSMTSNNRMKSAKDAATKFVEELLTEANNATRIALVSFADDATVHNAPSYFMSNSESDKQTLINSINNLSTGGGTFTQAGLKKAEDLLSGSNATQKNIVLLSDGAATYSYKIHNTNSYCEYWRMDNNRYCYRTTTAVPENKFKYDTTVGNGTSEYTYIGYYPYKHSYYYRHGASTIAQAGFFKSDNQTIYTIALQAGNEGNWTLNGVASEGKSFTANPDDLQSIFKEISGSIAYAAEGATIEDPMGDKFDLYIEDTSDLKWALIGTPEATTADIVISQGNIVSVENVHPYTIIWDAGNIAESNPATMTYYVDIHADASANVNYPTNDPTTIFYKDVYGNDIEKDFTIPEVSVGDTGKIDIVAYLVNENGEPLAVDGITPVDRPDLAKELDQKAYTVNSNVILDYGTYTISTSEINGSANLNGYEYSSNSSLNGGNTDPVTVLINPQKQNHTVYFGYEVGKYTVTFVDYDGAELDKQTDVAYGTGATAPTDPTRTGYTFTGWDVAFDNIIADTTVTAQYDISTQTINISVKKIWADDEPQQPAMAMMVDQSKVNPDITIKLMDGETEVASVKFSNGVTDHHFENLSMYDTNGDFIVYTIIEDPVEGYDSKVNYYMQDYYIEIVNTLKEFTVNYNSNGGTGTDPNETVVKYGSDVETITNPYEKKGNSFTGWNTQAHGLGTSYDEQVTFKMPVENVTLYAQWTPNTDISYNVYYVNIDTNKNLDTKIVSNQVFGNTVTESAIDIVGYVKQDPTSKSIPLEETDNVIYFYYKVRTDIDYTVNYLEKGTNAVLATAVTGTGIFGTNVTENAKDIENYNKVGEIEQTITLGIDGNVINFYYTKYEVIEDSDFFKINWKYETGYNTNVYNQRYTTDGEGSVSESDRTSYVQLHYDSKYTYARYETKTETVETVIVVDTTTGSSITASAITGTAIKVETTTTVDLYYDKKRSSRPKPPIIIEDPEVPLADLEKEDHFAYIIGYIEGDVRPENNITREEVAMIFYRLLTDESRNELLSDSNPFADIDTNRWSNRAISTLYNSGILKGYEDGEFKPTDMISRAEFAAISARFDKLELSSEGKFTDVSGHWAEKYINSSEVKGWIKGYEDNTFRPEKDITRAESMTLINNVLGRGVIEENIHPDAMQWPDNFKTAWYYEAVEEATNSHDYIRDENNLELWTGMKANKVWP